MGSGLVAGHVHGGGVALPAEGLGVRVLVHGLMVLVRGRSGAVPYQMDDIALLGVIVRTNEGAPAHAEGAALLLADAHALDHLGRAVTLLELGRVGQSLDGVLEVLRRADGCVLDVVGVGVVGVCTVGALIHSGQAVPRSAGFVLALRHRENNAVVNAQMIQALTGLIPFQFAHRSCSSFSFFRRLW